jgi:hypothetical protein
MTEWWDDGCMMNWKKIEGSGRHLIEVLS